MVDVLVYIILYTLIRPLIQEPFELEVRMQHMPFLFPTQNIPLEFKGS